MSRGHEHWHPDPPTTTRRGRAPCDMGPTTSPPPSLLGPVTRVAGNINIQIPERTITSQPKFGETIRVQTPDHVADTLDFACGAIGTIIDLAWRSQLPRIGIYGTEGTLSVPDPNSLGGPVRLCAANGDAWGDVPLTHGHADGRTMWGIGVADITRHRLGPAASRHGSRPTTCSTSCRHSWIRRKQAALSPSTAPLSARHPCPRPAEDALDD